MDLLDRVGQEDWNKDSSDRMGLFQPQRRKAKTVLLAWLSASLRSSRHPTHTFCTCFIDARTGAHVIGFCGSPIRMVSGAKLTRNFANGIANEPRETWPPFFDWQEKGDGTFEIADQIAALLAALRGHRLHPIVSLAVATGMRRGELLALRWSDVDLNAASLKVERSLEESKAKLRFKSPKTKHGRRTIILPASAVNMLRDHRKEQLELRL